MSFENLIAYIGSSFLITITPGIDNLYCLNISITQSFKDAFQVILGLCTGLFIHTLMTALGVGVLINSQKWAFQLFCLAGAIYLLYLSYLNFKNRFKKLKITNSIIEEKNLYFRGVVMNLINPKVGIFFIAYIPQFVEKSTMTTYEQIFILGLIFVGTCLIGFSVPCYFANKIQAALEKSTKVIYTLHLIQSVLFLAIGLKLLIVIAMSG